MLSPCLGDTDAGRLSSAQFKDAKMLEGKMADAKWYQWWSMCGRWWYNGEISKAEIVACRVVRIVAKKYKWTRR
jgi:hypothetical protein